MSFKEQFISKNRNPKGKKTGDCYLRAISEAFDIDYTELLKDYDYRDDGVSASNVCSMIFTLGGKLEYISKAGEEKVTVKQFCDKHKDGVYLVAVGKYNDGEINHLVCCKNGDWIDTWDSGQYLVYIIFYIDNDASDKK